MARRSDLGELGPLRAGKLPLSGSFHHRDVSLFAKQALVLPSSCLVSGDQLHPWGSATKGTKPQIVPGDESW